MTQIVAPDGQQDQVCAGDPLCHARLFHLSKKIPRLRTINCEVLDGDDEARLAQARRHALGVAAAARRVSRAARERVAECDDPERAARGNGRRRGREWGERALSHALRRPRAEGANQRKRRRVRSVTAAYCAGSPCGSGSKIIS